MKARKTKFVRITCLPEISVYIKLANQAKTRGVSMKDNILRLFFDDDRLMLSESSRREKIA